MAYLDVVTLVIVTAFTEKSVMYNTVDVELIKEWVTVLMYLLAFVFFEWLSNLLWKRRQ